MAEWTTPASEWDTENYREKVANPGRGRKKRLGRDRDLLRRMQEREEARPVSLVLLLLLVLAFPENAP